MTKPLMTQLVAIDPATYVAQSNPPEQAKAGRFRETRGVRAMRTLMRTLSRCAPWIATHAGYHMLATPPRVAERPWQRELRL